MKKLKFAFILIAAIFVVILPNHPVFAYSTDVIGENDIPEGASILQKEIIKETPLMEKHILRYEIDGREMIDETIIEYHQNPMLRSDSGSNTVSRTKTESGRWSITIKATFSWSNGKSYCDSATFSKTTYGDFINTKFDTETGNSAWLGIQKAYAKVNYHFCMQSAPTFYNSGKFEIICSTTGAISDNG